MIINQKYIFILKEYGHEDCRHKSIVYDSSTTDGTWYKCVDCGGRGKLVEKKWEFPVVDRQRLEER
jgi:hypothetical protein